MRLEEISTLKLMSHDELVEVAARVGVEPPHPDSVFTAAEALRLAIIEAVLEQELHDTDQTRKEQHGTR